MAAANAATTLLLLLLLLLCFAADDAAADNGFTTFKLYFHDILSGTAPTAVRIAEAASTNASSSSFGAVVAIDDQLTTGPAHAAGTEVGRAQGTYTFADQKTYGLLMVMSFVFTAGEHNGSTLSIFGRNEVLTDVREMNIVGGTGKFRMARGYVQAHTVDSGFQSGEAIVEYTVNVKA